MYFYLTIKFHSLKIYRNSYYYNKTLTLRPTAPLAFLLGGASKILCWRLGGRVEYSGIHFRSPTSGPKFSISRFSLLHASSISSWPRIDEYNQKGWQSIKFLDRIRIPDSSNIFKGFFKKFKKLSATYVLKINVLGILYNSLPRIEPDFKRYYI